ncbi:hemerythrin domain-containing protein [Vulcanisaeta sp. JCM 16161]|uniref:hemerythrin domain-containing protein n=1 Tax=Vulcanisaeta sp. JCM 16161 TaxID=1295372 RepID=UPI0006D09FE0|nr:hemerythrin domain-containing protein [Vulcanisaeta sp. JCM 16161]
MIVKVNTAYVVDNLIKDHDVILGSLKVLYRVINSDNPDARDLELLIQFFDSFIDKCHHAKEEYILFPTLNLRLFPFEGSPVYVMVTEHGIARYLIRMSEELLRMWLIIRTRVQDRH